MSEIKKHEKFVNALNVEGIFFQKYCTHLIKKSGWKVDNEEYPVTFPKPSSGILGKDGRLDIRASKKVRQKKLNVVIDLLIECKKADPNLSSWIFFKSEKKLKHSYILNCKLKEKINKESKGHSKWEIETFSRDFSKSFKLSKIKVCNDGRELKSEFTKKPQKNDTKTSTARIQNGACQVCHAFRSLYADEIDFLREVLNKNNDPKDKTHIRIFIPIVVTTADLYVANFKAGDVKKIEGVIDYRKVKFSKSPQLLYEFPLPGHLQFSPMEKVNFPIKLRESFIKMPVIFVNIRALDKLLKKLSLS